MDLLGAVNKFLWETAMSDQVITLDNAADDVLQAKEWIASSWLEFQATRLWKFRWAEGSIDVVKGKTRYTADDLGRVNGDKIIRGSFYNSAGDISSITYTDLRDIRRRGADVSDVRVTDIAVEVGPLFETFPDVATTQTIAYDYWKAASVVLDDTDTFVGLPAEFHMAIVHLALTNYGAHIAGQEGANAYAHHGGKYAVLKNSFILFAGEDNQIPVIKKSLL
jgi:hypothetical protein